MFEKRRTFERKCLKKIKRAIIGSFYLLPIKKNKIVFQNFLGKGYGCNPKYIAEEIITENLPYELVWLCNDLQSEFPPYVRKVRYGSLRAYYELATAKIWVDNVRNGLRVRKKKGQYYIQTWHAPFGVKCVEKDAENLLPVDYVKTAKIDGSITDVLLANSYLQEQQYKRAFWISKHTQILRCGLPRNDFLVNNANDKKIKDDLREKYGFSKESYIILYAPTFRDDGSMKGYQLDFHKILNAFRKKMHKECDLIIRLHPNVQNQSDFVRYEEHIHNGSLYSDIQELSLLSDCVISDYSTSVFDFAMMDKPVFICALDLEEYEQKRGLLKEFYEFPFPHSYNNEELITQITNFDREKYYERAKNYFLSNPIYDKGKSAQELVKWMIEKIDNNL
ncbi:CDP-glycerol glycerophosphotransferase family protein [Turicibacter sp. GALT-G1]|uniref:CDP-glycerol glycerophosphotransferase family protein n=1 Tax=Turicibacter sp. GALT-G1 TaxID=2951140 RepID=UPI0021D4F972|nr:CDP-glycerol glycerophosphotransferase family protein [Turicibacter sp. GALT-G1]MCU7207424.1 CDP-glycerol glycerophosphotransferase family protein [Turicibacter sp. GALT-G1]